MPGSSVQSTHRAAGLESLPPLNFTAWPIASRRLWTDAPVWLLLLAGGGAWLATGSARMAAFAAAVMLLATWRFYLPVGYLFDNSGIHQQILGRRRLIRWSTIRKVQRRRGSLLVYLSPADSPLDAFSATCIPLMRRGPQITAWIERFAPAAMASIASASSAPGAWGKWSAAPEELGHKTSGALPQPPAALR